MSFPGVSDAKESTCNAGDPDLTPGMGRFPWRREWLLTLVFLLGKSHGQTSLVGYSPWGHKDSDTTEWLTLSLFHKYPCSLKKEGRFAHWLFDNAQELCFVANEIIVIIIYIKRPHLIDIYADECRINDILGFGLKWFNWGDREWVSA